MTTLAPTLPPPLSAPPSVATLQRLLDGLQQPMQRGVPSPPAVHAATVARDCAVDGEVVDITRLEGATPDPTPRTVSLTWSAGRTRAHARRTAAVTTASAVAVGVLTALAAAGELGLP